MLRNGIGTKYYFSSDKNVRGKWKDGKLEFYEMSQKEEEKGYVLFNYEDKIYVGKGENMLPNGWGKLVSKDNGNLSYEGKWKNGFKSGKGIYYKSEVGFPYVEYVGSFRNGSKNGMGRFYDKRGYLRYEG